MRAAQGCADIALAYGAPFISGKDSLYNEYETEKESICIPPTLLISAMAVMEDVSHAVSMDSKQEGDLIYIVGATYNELGGSHYYAVHGAIGSRVPKVNPEKGKQLMDSLSAAMALLGAGICMGFGGIGPGIGNGMTAGSAVRWVARNVEHAAELMRTMLVGQAVSQSTAIYAMVISLVLIFVV